MKTTVDLPAPLLKRAKRLAAKRGTTLKSLLEFGLRRILDEEQAEPFQLRRVTYKGQGSDAQNQSWDAIAEQIYRGRGGDDRS